jgi:hypothetical protein
MSFKEQLINLYLLNLQSICDEDKLFDVEDGVNSILNTCLFQLYRYYQTNGSIPKDHMDYLTIPINYLLTDIYNDYCSDMESEGKDKNSFDEFVEEWKDEPLENTYGSNGCYDLYSSSLNSLKKILRLT